MIKPAPRILIAGTGSGCGKTTTVCAVLQAFKNRGLAPMSFKCGPDYIDPMFHTGIIGVDSENLDIFFAGEEGVRSAFGTEVKSGPVGKAQSWDTRRLAKALV